MAAAFQLCKTESVSCFQLHKRLTAVLDFCKSVTAVLRLCKSVTVVLRLCQSVTAAFQLCKCVHVLCFSFLTC